MQGGFFVVTFPAHQASRPTNFAFPPASAGQKATLPRRRRQFGMHYARSHSQAEAGGRNLRRSLSLARRRQQQQPRARCRPASHRRFSSGGELSKEQQAQLLE